MVTCALPAGELEVERPPLPETVTNPACGLRDLGEGLFLELADALAGQVVLKADFFERQLVARRPARSAIG